MAEKDILEFVQSSKNITDADSDDENEMNYVPTLPGMNIIKKDFNLFEVDSSLDDHKSSCSMRLEYCIIFLGSLTGEGGRKLEHPVAKLLVVAAIVGFSDTWSVTEEKRTGDDKKVMEAEETIHCILSRLWYPSVEMDHFSDSIFYTVVYGQIDSYGEVFVSLDNLSI
ncbi:hypothetical protein TNCV_466941 [Trichonephila clavipes]|nr:hypothetical protein TNCV_466941 [Trichonephila clavipes]